MLDILRSIRKPILVSFSKKLVFSILALALGVLLGLLSKVLDETAYMLPMFIQQLDLRNFFSRIGIWIFIGICISLFSKSPLKAGIDTFLFFAGMVSSYYLYTIFISGFFPRSYMMIWIAMTAVSPFLGVICWYAKGTHIVSMCISSIIIMVMARQAFNMGYWYFDIAYILELILLIATIAVLYKNPNQITVVALSGIALSFITSPLNLLGGMM